MPQQWRNCSYLPDCMVGAGMGFAYALYWSVYYEVVARESRRLVGSLTASNGFAMALYLAPLSTVLISTMASWNTVGSLVSALYL
ncbi:hypothetical protein OK016_16965 [Vibrio chagasii]|nr:hypothetical protein [Vibrio chagasii]